MKLMAMSASFLSAEDTITAGASETQPLVTCLFPECLAVVPWAGYVCYSNDNDPNKKACEIQNRPTPDQINGVCWELEFKSILCKAGEVIYACQVIKCL